MVQDGMIGVKRHQHYFVGKGDYLASDEYKINLLGVNIHFQETGIPISPNDLVAAGLFSVFESMDVPPTNLAVEPKTGQPYRDRWR
jgi:hypothetical protein